MTQLLSILLNSHIFSPRQGLMHMRIFITTLWIILCYIAHRDLDAFSSSLDSKTSHVVPAVCIADQDPMGDIKEVLISIDRELPASQL